MNVKMKIQKVFIFNYFYLAIPIDIQDIKALCEYGVIAPDSGILQLKFQSKASTAVEYILFKIYIL